MLTDIEIYKDLEAATTNDKMNAILNVQPKADWVKTHPIYKNQYLPIDKIEFLLTKIFQRWRVEVLSTNMMLNSICVTVRLHFMNPSTNEWDFHDGVGAHAIQVDKGAKATDINAVKIEGVMLALPIAKSRAIGDAADHIGRIFGRDLNRKDTVQNYTREENNISNTKF